MCTATWRWISIFEMCKLRWPGFYPGRAACGRFMPDPDKALLLACLPGANPDALPFFRALCQCGHLSDPAMPIIFPAMVRTLHMLAAHLATREWRGAVRAAVFQHADAAIPAAKRHQCHTGKWQPQRCLLQFAGAAQDVPAGWHKRWRL